MADPIPTTVQDQVEQAEQLTAEQQAELLAEAKKELGLAVKALRSGNRETAVAQYLAGLHGLRFINLCRQAGKARSFATEELERDLSWWLGRSVDASLIIRTYASIRLLHGDIEPPPSKSPAAIRNEWSELVDRLPPVGQFHKAWSQMVERVENGEESWVLLPGYEDKCKALYEGVQNEALKLDDQVEGGKVVEKGILTITRELMIDYMRYKADKLAAEAAEKEEAKEQFEEQAKEFEDKAQEQQKAVKSLLEQAASAKPEDKERIEAEAKEAAKVLDDYRKSMRQLVDQAAAMAKEQKKAEQEALDSEKKAEKGTARLEKRRGDADNGQNLPWQALGENAAAKASVKDLAGALYGIISKNPEPEDVLYEVLAAWKRSEDSSNRFKQAMAAFAMTWERQTRTRTDTGKVPA